MAIFPSHSRKNLDPYNWKNVPERKQKRKFSVKPSASKPRSKMQTDKETTDDIDESSYQDSIQPPSLAKPQLVIFYYIFFAIHSSQLSVIYYSCF